LSQVISFGCRLNLAEGEALRQATAGEDDLILINSCAVTAEAERQARQAIRRVAREAPEKRIVVTGCGAVTSADRFAAMPEVSRVADSRSLRNTALPALSGADHARAFIEVQNGCDHDCTFCITTLARGDSRSIQPERVIETAQRAVESGRPEIILTGVDLTSYGADLPEATTLGALVAALLTRVPGLRRLRLSSLDCIEVDALLFELLTSEARMMPHVHLSLQSGDDMILKRMKRRHSRAQAVALVERLKSRRSEITIGADLIAGFPTEDDAMFANSLALLQDCDIVLPHIFPYSPRPETAAARMPQVPRETVKSRANLLREAATARQLRWLSSHIGSAARMLVERDGVTGRAENYAPIRLSQPATPGAIIDVTLAAVERMVLRGEP
jgi:threonylcarbamoyladenosine tRNA methylthiotransferase MtaB